MTLRITIPADVEIRLKGDALRTGLDVEAFASKLILDHYPQMVSESDDALRLRGVIPLQRDRDSIFEQNVSLKVEELPKWTPEVFIGRALTEEDDV